jgi:hypothetical protein
MAVVRSLAIWIVWLLASLAVGGMIGAWLLGIEGTGAKGAEEFGQSKES